MKQLKLLFLLIILAAPVASQTTSSEVIASVGNSYTSEDLQIDWTLGELASTSLQAPNASITQGFHQPNSDATQMLMGCDENSTPICASEETVLLGEEVCVSITATNFSNISGYQHSIQFDPTILTFKEVIINAEGISDLALANFNTNLPEGTLTFGYDNTSGNAINIADGTEIYQLCFFTNGAGNSPIAFTNSPTDATIIDADTNELPFLGGDGFVDVITCEDINIQIDTTICANEDITINGSVYTTSGVYTNVLVASTGCDSIIQLNLNVAEVDHEIPSFISVCSGEQALLEVPEGLAIGILGSSIAPTQRILLSPSENDQIIEVTDLLTECKIQQNVRVEALPLPTITIAGNARICVGEQTILTVSGGESYEWSTGETSPSISAGAGTYRVTGIDANGCSNDASIIVGALALPLAEITGATQVCAGEQTALTASGGLFYEWNTTATSATITAGVGNYSVTVTDQNNCSDVASIEILASSAPTITISGNAQVCAGEQTILTVSGGESYEWSTGETSSSISAGAGTYRVTGIDANGCSNDASIIVGALALPLAEITGATQVCIGEQTTLTASGGLFYEWNTTATSATITAGVGSYSVTVTDQNNCSDVASIEILASSAPTITIAGNAQVCVGEQTILTVSGGESYEWSTGETSSSISAGAGTYRVTGIDANGCSNDASIVVEASALPLAEITGATQVCTGEQTTLTASGGMFYEWSTGETSESINVSTGTYSVTVADENNCNNTTSIEVMGDNEAPVFLFCPADITKMLNRAEGATQSPIYWLDPVAEDNCGASNVTLTATRQSGAFFAFGEEEVTYTATDAAGNTTTCSFTITVEPSVDLTFYVEDTDYTYEDGLFCIPIKVENCENLTSFQYTIVVPDENSRISAVEVASREDESIILPELAFEPINDNTYTFSWPNPNAVNLTLEDGTTIFTLKIRSNVAPGSCIEVAFIDEPTEIFATIDLSDDAVLPTTIDGEVCALGLASITGRIYKTDNTPLDDVLVHLNENMQLDTTINGGSYEFLELDAGIDYIVRPSEHLSCNDGLNTRDLILIRRHLLGIVPFDDPYLLIAADVDRSRSVNVGDIIQIQDRILNRTQSFANSTDWRFLPVDFSFSNPAQPWIFPEQADLINLQQDTAIDFYGIRLGDVDLNACDLNLLPTISSRAKTTIHIKDVAFQANEIIEVPISIKDLSAIEGYEFEMDFNTDKLEFLGVKAGDISSINDRSFGYKDIAEGILRTLWLRTTKEEGNEQNNNLFTLQFKTKQSGVLANTIRLKNTLLQATAFDEYGVPSDMDIVFIPALTAKQLVVIGNNPNPFTTSTNILFTLPIEDHVKLTIHNAAGQLVHETEATFESGIHNWTVDAQHLAQSGIYYYTISTPTTIVVDKLIYQKDK